MGLLGRGFIRARGFVAATGIAPKSDGRSCIGELQNLLAPTGVLGDITVTFDGTRWVVAGADDVAIDERSRPYLIHLGMLQEMLL